MKPTADPTRTTLLLAAHGSTRPATDNPVRRLADLLRARGVYTQVVCGFLKEPPLLADVLAAVTTEHLRVVPMLTGHGYISDELIPRALVDFSGTVDLDKPLGTAAAVPGLLADRARAVIAGHGLDGNDTALMIAAHGNARNPENARHARTVAERTGQLAGGLPVTAAFIEEAPLISSWREITASKNLIGLPFLIGGGLHGAEDVPAMLGLEEHADTLAGLTAATPCVGPLPVEGRNIWYCRSLGYEPALADVILGLSSPCPPPVG